ncbi:MAG: substrate-binding domain-containing protein, partial [Thermoflexales bacterium]|nr:substrate-binding domain-containing protein [Thermoflexales bacterium]
MSDVTPDITVRAEQAHRTAKRPTMAYLASEVAVGTTPMAIWSGVVAGAQEHDLNLIGFAGGNIGPQPAMPQGNLAPANIIYKLVTPEICSGVVAWGLTLSSSDRELEAIHARYRPLPIVTVSRAVAGHPVVVADNNQGMRELVAHLVETHGCRRLAFIRGPAHPIAEERYRAYLEALAHYGIPFDPALVTPAWDWQSESGERAVALFLDERGLRPRQDVDAIVASSDLTALAALEALHNRGIRVPDDLALVGFNNSPEAQCAIPPITSAAAPLYEQGRRSVGALKNVMEQASVPERILIPARLVVHQGRARLPRGTHAAEWPARAGDLGAERRPGRAAGYARAG